MCRAHRPKMGRQVSTSGSNGPKRRKKGLGGVFDPRRGGPPHSGSKKTREMQRHRELLASQTRAPPCEEKGFRSLVWKLWASLQGQNWLPTIDSCGAGEQSMFAAVACQHLNPISPHPKTDAHADFASLPVLCSYLADPHAKIFLGRLTGQMHGQ